MEIEGNPFTALNLVGGRWCLDFANTAGTHVPEVRSELLHGYADVVRWAVRAGVLPEAEAGGLLARASAQPKAAEAVHRRAIELREAIYGCFSARAAGAPVREGDLAVVNREVARAMPHARLVPADGRYEWAWDDSEDLDRVLWPLARSAAELLTAEDVDRVKECAGDTCGWLYVDTSRNRSRRWCDMKECGNRAKARRHYRRQRAAGE